MYGGGGAASRLIDGSNRQDWGSKSCQHSKKENKPWVRIDVGATRAISAIRIYGRTDCCDRSQKLRELKALGFKICGVF